MGPRSRHQNYIWINFATTFLSIWCPQLAWGISSTAARTNLDGWLVPGHCWYWDSWDDLQDCAKLKMLDLGLASRFKRSHLAEFVCWILCISYLQHVRYWYDLVIATREFWGMTAWWANTDCPCNEAGKRSAERAHTWHQRCGMLCRTHLVIGDLSEHQVQHSSVVSFDRNNRHEKQHSSNSLRISNPTYTLYQELKVKKSPQPKHGRGTCAMLLCTRNVQNNYIPSVLTIFLFGVDVLKPLEGSSIWVTFEGFVVANYEFSRCSGRIESCEVHALPRRPHKTRACFFLAAVRQSVRPLTK